MKKIFLLFISALISIASFAQTGSASYSGVFERVNDTTAYQSSASIKHSQGYADSYWNNQSARPHFDMWNGSSYTHVFDFNAGGSGGGSNFWPITGTKALTGNVIITGASGTHSVSIGNGTDNINDFNINADGNVNISPNALFVTSSGISDLNSSTQASLSSGSNQISVQPTGISLTTGADATGDLYYRSSPSGYLTPRAIGTSGQILTVSGGIPVWSNPATSGTVTSVTSANSDATVANTTTTPVITIVSAPKLTTARTIGTITGDATSAGSSFDGTTNNTNALTLATVNSNVGSFGSSISIPTFTVNGKGLITAASGNSVIAPAGTLTGTTLNSSVVTSSLTSVGTIGTGVWNGTRLTNAYTPQGSGISVWGVTGSSTADQASITGTANQVLRVNSAGTSLGFGAVDISTGSVTGTLPMGNGGTGATSFTANRVIIGNGSSPLTTNANLVYDGNSFYISNTSNQIILGTTNTTTITASVPTASRTYGIPDTGANSNFVMTDGNQTVGGTKTFSSTIQSSNGGIATTANSIGWIFKGGRDAATSISLGSNNTYDGTNVNNTMLGFTSTAIGYTTGTNTNKVLRINPTISTSGGTNTVYLLDIDPTNTSLTGTSLYSIRTSSGAGPVLIGGTTVTASTKVDVRGTGTSSSTITQRWADSGNTLIGQFTDDGALTLNAKISGRATLVAGTVTVSTSVVATGDEIFLTNRVTGGTVGFLSVGTVTAGTSFVINSSSNTDTSQISWLIVKH